MSFVDFSHLSNALRFLAVDAVELAKSGHPGMPMGMADIATVLWRKYLSHSPKNINWWNRDRFVLSNGHGSMLLYALLHLSGYELSIDDLKAFRKLHSKTPGHPEYRMTVGVETTTGPLGQGLSNAVGFALAESLLSKEFNTEDISLIDHYSYAFVGDGCLMEGISHEACALAATWKLNKLIVFYDDNGISIDGEVIGWMSESVPDRFRAYGWNVIDQVNGHNEKSIDEAIDQAKKSLDKPTLIICKTNIGHGSPNKAGTESVHGSPLGTQEILATRESLTWTHEPFVIPEEIYTEWSALAKSDIDVANWEAKWILYQERYPAKALALKQRMEKQASDAYEKAAAALLEEAINEKAPFATRQSSKKALDKLAPFEPLLLGGSADLSGSNLTDWKGSKPLHNGGINYISYGVREFAMAAIMNGLYLHGGFIPYGGTFLVFSDYSRNAIRLAALMKLGVIHVLTHDSIGLGEDGPTHQPVEHAASLRYIPGLVVWRPGDYLETAVAWLSAIEYARQKLAKPAALLLSRQSLPALPNATKDRIELIKKGGYVLVEASNNEPELIIIGTGSEVHLAVEARERLEAKGLKVRVVSMPSTSLFDLQTVEYRTSVLPKSLPVIAVEAGLADFWYKYTGHSGAIIGMNTFGESAPASDLFKHFGITVDAIVEAANHLIK
ncbi:MAG: transketolase [Pseudomonadota bacterium]